MSKDNNHIISRLRFESSFDKKENGIALQERISAWSKTNMQKEIATIFDSLCPVEQTWRVKMLEVDLGRIDYDNLEKDLSLKLQQQLRKQLHDLILDSNNNDKNLEIETDNFSKTSILRNYLITGAMPWNYKSTDGPINKMLAAQLINNKKEIIEMITEVATVHENIRKRIAWQIDESNLVKVIEGLEPTSHTQILNFKDELKTIQQKEGIVHANSSDFGKNIWLWILNYLFTDRGTIFNKVTFMKSSLHQMASHYNLEYSKLLNTIILVVESVTENSNSKSDFILILSVLSKENKNNIVRNKNTPNIDYWTVLENHFQSVTQFKTNDKTNEFNELVLELSKQDKTKFKELIFNLKDSKSKWKSVINNLNDTSLEIIFSILTPTNSEMYIESIHFISKKSIELNLKINRNTIWEIGVDFLLANKNASNNSKLFLNYCIDRLCKKENKSRIILLDQLTDKKITNVSKTSLNLTIYTNLIAILSDTIVLENEVYFSNHFNTLLNELGNQINTETTDKNRFVLLQNQLTKYSRINSSRFLELLIKYENKKVLRQLLPYILSSYDIDLLIKQIDKEKYDLLINLHQYVTTSMQENDAVKKMLLPLHENLFLVGLQTIILHPEYKKVHFFETIVDELESKIENSEQKNYTLFIARFLNNNTLVKSKLSSSILIEIAEQFNNKDKQTIIEKVLLLLKSSSIKQELIAKLLLQHFYDSYFVQLRANKTNDCKLILNYLLTNGSHFFDELFMEYSSLIKTEKELTELLWKCFLDFDNYFGKKEALKRLVHISVALKYQVAITENLGFIEKKSTNKLVINDLKITIDKLYLLIKDCISDEKLIVLNNEKEIALKELFAIGLELNPNKVREILRNISITENRIHTLNTIQDWGNFSLWIASDGENSLSETFELMKSTFDFISHFMYGNNLRELQHLFWKQSWEIIKGSSHSQIKLENFLHECLDKLFKKETIDSKNIISEISSNNFQITSKLKDVLIKYNAAFSVVNQNPIPTIASEDSINCHRLGLVEQLCFQLIAKKQIPVWYPNNQKLSEQELFQELIINYPTKFINAVKNKSIVTIQKHYLSKLLPFNKLIDIISNLNKNKYQSLVLLGNFYNSIGNITIKGITGKGIQDVIYKKAVIAWTEENWAIISEENIWQELFWEVCFKRNIKKKDFIEAVEKIKYSLPLSYKITFEDVSKSAEQTNKNATKSVPPIIKKQLFQKQSVRSMTNGISVKNAGIVLLNNYIITLFERLEIVKNKLFIDESSSLNAVHYLQYVVTGLCKTEEMLLQLNKVLCGLSIETPVTDSIEISENHKIIINSLINAAISHWPSVGDSSINGFRGNWLVRDGLLVEKEDRWELTVEKRAYDLLIHKSPFSFSIIKYPWMSKPLHVVWPY